MSAMAQTAPLMGENNSASTRFESDDAYFEDRVRFFTDYLTPHQERPSSFNYTKIIRDMLHRKERRLIVSIDEIRGLDRSYADGIINNPGAYMPAFDRALQDIVSTLFDKSKYDSELIEQPFYVGIKGSFGEQHVTPRTIRAHHLSKMVSVEGIVTRCSLVRPKMIKSIHYCEKTKKHYFKEYRDATMNGALATSSTAFPKEDPDGNPLSVEFGFSTFRDHQVICLQEMPERAPPGQLPRSVEAILDDDLVDRCKPGDRIQLVGHYRSIGARTSQSSSAVFRTVIVSNNVTLLSSKGNGGIAHEMITDKDIRNINKIAKREDVIDVMAHSLAPSIFGHEYIKKALLFLLLGGIEKNLENGTHIRGDINILLVGDPSTAKSQLLRFVLNTAPLAIATTGRGSSGVGLTAAVTTDKETGERRLEAGAMVLADRGVVCIDEFDKMSDIDRVAIHEVMEQQTVTIAKAGIHTSLNARCSVIAAANPVFGQYDPYKDPHRNIALPDSLLSRFDLLFVVTDTIDEERDRLISEHVLKMHRYVSSNSEDNKPMKVRQNPLWTMEAERHNEAKETPVFERNGILNSRSNSTKSSSKKILSIEFIKKYIQYAHRRIQPTLTDEASEKIVSTFSALRNDMLDGHQRRTSPITARTLETLIRLATAHAKARLSRIVEVKDAEGAEEIVRFALFKEVASKSRRKRAKKSADELLSDDEDLSLDDLSDLESEVFVSQGTRSRGSKPTNTNERQPLSSIPNINVASNVRHHGEESSEIQQTNESTQMSFASDKPLEPESSMHLSSNTIQIEEQRIQLFTEKLGQLLLRSESLFVDDCANVEDALTAVNEGLTQKDLYSLQEALAALRKMSDRNQIMLDGNTIYKL